MVLTDIQEEHPFTDIGLNGINTLFVTEGIRQKYAIRGDFEDGKNIIVRDISNKPNPLTAEEDISIPGGYFIKKVTIMATVNAGNTHSEARSKASVVLKDGTEVAIGSRTNTHYNSSTYWVNYDLTTWDESVWLNIDHIHYSLYVYSGATGEGASASVTCYMSSISPWMAE